MFILFKHLKQSHFYILFALVFASTFLGVLFGTSYYNVKSTYYFDSLPDKLKDDVNVLVAGIDDNGTSVDFIAIINIEPRKSSIKITPVPDDTLVNVVDANHPLKNVYSIGGEEMFLEKISSVTGADITYHAFAKFSTFENIIDIYNGFEFNVPFNMAYSDSKSHADINIKSGKQDLNGEDALDILRYAKLNLDKNEYNEICANLIKEFMYQKLNAKDIEKTPDAIREFLRNAATDFTSEDVETYMSIAKSIVIKDIETDAILGKYEAIDGYTYFIPDLNSVKEIFEKNKAPDF